MSINAVGRQSFLGVGGENGGKIHCTGTLRAIESPDCLRPCRVHVHCLRAVAPAGCHGNGGTDIVLLEFLCAGRRLGHSSDGGVGNDAFYRRTVPVAQIAADEFGHSIGQCHCLVFQ